MCSFHGFPHCFYTVLWFVHMGVSVIVGVVMNGVWVWVGVCLQRKVGAFENECNGK